MIEIFTKLKTTKNANIIGWEICNLVWKSREMIGILLRLKTTKNAIKIGWDICNLVWKSREMIEILSRLVRWECWLIIEVYVHLLS